MQNMSPLATVLTASQFARQNWPDEATNEQPNSDTIIGAQTLPPFYLLAEKPAPTSGALQFSFHPAFAISLIDTMPQ